MQIGMTARTVAVLMGGLAGATPAAARACPGPAVAGQLPGAEPVPVCVEEVRFSADGLSLAGQWFTPREPGSAGPLPAAVLIRGSGPSHRGSVWTETLAGVLVAEGVGVLVPDKRGSGASEGDWRAASFSALADDALAGVRYLAGRPDVDAARVGLMGLSQGGMVAPVAASRTDSVAFVVNVVGSAVPLLESVRFEMLHTFREEGLEGERLETAMALVDTAVGHIRGRISWDDYEAALHGARPVLGDEIADAYFIPTPDHWRWAFFRRLEGFDALDAWRGVDQPALVLLGAEDTNTPTPPTARRLRALFESTDHPDATVVVFDGLGHALWRMDGPPDEHGLDPEVRSTLASWIRRVTRP